MNEATEPTKAGQARMARGAAKVRKLEADLAGARAQLDAVLCREHDAGVSIAALSRATGLSRQSIYAAIGRHRAQLGA